jgi:hypothetical protein
VTGNMSFPRSRPTSSRSRESHTVMRDPEGNEFCVEPGPVGR